MMRALVSSVVVCVASSWAIASPTLQLTPALELQGPFVPSSTIRHDTGDAQYIAHAAQSQFAAVGRHSVPGTCSFTVIQTAVDNGQWGLTAAHCLDITNNGTLLDENHADDTFTIGAETKSILPGKAFIHPSYNGNINFGYDIGLVKFNSAFVSVTPAQIYTGTSELGATVTSVGFGTTGNGQTGQTLPAGTKRAVDNVMDQFITLPGTPSSSALLWDFDEPAPRTSPNITGSSVPLPLEGSIAQGDSGGGTFINDGGWFVAGVHSGIVDDFDYPNTLTSPNDLATYGDRILTTRVSTFAPWINATTIPEPSPLWFMGVASCGVIIVRRLSSLWPGVRTKS